MTVSDVKNYRFLDRAIVMAAKRVDKCRAVPYFADKVVGSNPDYPYEKRGFLVDGSEQDVITAYQVELSNAQKDYDRLVTLKAEIEALLSSLENARDVIIFERTMKGDSQGAIAITLGCTQASVSRRLAKLCEKTRNCV